MAKLKELLEQARGELSRSRQKRLRRDYEKLLATRAWEDETLDVFRAIIERSLGSGFSPRIPEPVVEKGKGDPEAAVLCIGDSHVGKIVRPDRTLGFEEYNLDVFSNRAWHLQETAIKLMTRKLFRPPKVLWVFFLGDLVEGALHHHQEIPQRELVAEQVLYAAHTFYQMLGAISRVVPVKVRGVTGNHGRWPGQAKVPTENRFSNFDWITMGMVKAMTDLTLGDRVEFKLSKAPFLVEDVEGWRIKVGHGDHLRGGDKAMGVPAHAIGREVNATTQRYAARGEKPPAFYIVGDKHRKMELPTATGRYLVNGAFFDADDYGIHANFTPNRPHQMFFGMDREKGRTWTYDIALDLAKTQHGYTYPEWS